MDESNQKVCVDANLWVKRFVEEEKSDEARDLFYRWHQDSVIFIAPSFLLFEFSSTLRKKEHFKLLREGDGNLALELFYDYPILLYQSEEYLEVTWDLAKRMNETVLYDVGYLALASWQKVPFYTADEKFYKRAKKFYPESYLI